MSLIHRETLREDVLGYGTCLFKPTLLSRNRVLEVIDNIDEGVVYCKDCKLRKECKHDLGDNGFCSQGK